MNLEDYCMIFDNALDPKACDDIINMFNNNSQYHERYDNNKKPNFTQLNFTEHSDINKNLHDYVTQSALIMLEKYKESVKDTFFWPDRYSYEQFRIKYYQKGTDDQFDDHVDSISNSTAKRFFAFFWYLNDVEEGGETEFLNFNMKIRPKKGRLFMFPPLWLYPHRGNPVISDDKYLLSSYLHYMD